MKEIWKPLPNSKGKYEISDQGSVKSLPRMVNGKGDSQYLLKERILTPSFNKDGYHLIKISIDEPKSILVHQLVALTFIDGFVRGTNLNHINGIKTDNRAENIEVSDPSHNALHAHRTGLAPKLGISKYHNVCYVSDATAVLRWRGCISIKGKVYGQKAFHTEVEAALHVDSLLDEIGDTQRRRNLPIIQKEIQNET